MFSFSMPKAFTCTLAFAALVLLPTPSIAYIVDNTEFKTDLSGWTQTGAWTHNATAGQGFFGSTGYAQTAGTGVRALSQCGDVSSVAQGHTVSGGGSFYLEGHTSPVELTIELYSGANCTGSLIGQASDSQGSPASGFFQTLYAPIQIPTGGALSARIGLQVSHASSVTTRFDSISLRHDLLINGHFTTDMSPWVQTPPASWTRVNQGLGEPKGAAQGVIGDAGGGNGQLFLAQCRLLSEVPTTGLLFSVIRIAVTNLGTANSYQLSYQFHAGTTCGAAINAISVEGRLLSPQSVGPFYQFLHFIPVPAAAQSVTVFFAVNPGTGSTPGAFVTLDDWVLTVSSDLVFEDGFESGNTTDWQ